MTHIAITYEELSHRAGISILSARRIANRRKWRKVRGNKGRTLAHVPCEYLEKHEAHSAENDKSVPVTAPATVPAAVPVAEIMVRLDRLQAELIEAAARRGADEALIEELRADRDEWKAQADAWRAHAETAQQQQVQAAQQQDELRQDRDMWRAQIEGARSEVERARNETEQARNELAAYRARPWWRRAFG